MPGLFVILSVAAFAVMAITGASSKTPSPSAPKPVPPPLKPVTATLSKAISMASAGMKPGDKKGFTFEGGQYGIKAEADGSFVAGPLMKKGEAWLVTFDVAVSPGSKFDKQTFEKSITAAVSGNIDVRSFSWVKDLTAQVAIVPKVDMDDDLSMKIGVPTSVATASITITDARRVPAVA